MNSRSSFASAWRHTCRQHATRSALAYGETSWTYAEIEGLVAALQAEVAEFSSRVFLFSPANDPISVIFILAALAAGAVPVLADPVWSSEERMLIMRRDHIDLEISYQQDRLMERMRTTGPRLSDFACVSYPEIERTKRLRADTVVCRFTSGSTNLPRSLQFTWEAIDAAATGWRKALSITADDRVLCLASLNNGLAFNTSFLSVFMAGAQLTFLPGRLLASGIDRAFVRHRPTIFVAFPFIYEMMMRAKRRLCTDDLRYAVSSASKLDAQASEYWRTQGMPVCNYYGLVEAGPVTCNIDCDERSLGAPLPHAEVLISREPGITDPTEPGIVRVKSPSLASDYLDDDIPRFSENLDATGHYVTRDRGYLDTDGRLVLLGRTDDMLNIHGRKIQPNEIREAIAELEGVSDVIVKGNEHSGRVSIVAYIESASVDEKQVLHHCRTRLAPYKVPHFIHVFRKFPRSSTGKISIGQMQLQSTGSRDVRL